jgi:hypothetical protein
MIIVDRGVKFRIRGDDVRPLVAEFERHPGKPLSRRHDDRPAALCRTGEADLGHARVPDERLTRLVASGGDVDHTKEGIRPAGRAHRGAAS